MLPYSPRAGDYVGALVLSPTRELASQIHEEALALTGQWGRAGGRPFRSVLPTPATHRKRAGSKMIEGGKKSV